ncbi:MAG: DUF2934 domain-containing protein [Acidobacteria bacterium]|nr:DUF2934 domain-containing protein [Acidobacteriota bacterium]
MAKSRKKNPYDAPQSQPAPATTGPDATSSNGHERIAMRAYEIYVERGGADGRDKDDWFAAERELYSESRSEDDKP